MVPSIRSWIDRHRIANFLAITCAFTWIVQGLLATSGMGAPWTPSALVGFGGFEPLVGAVVAVALVVGTEQLSAHEVPNPSGLGLNNGDSRPTDSKGVQSIGRECQE